MIRGIVLQSIAITVAILFSYRWGLEKYGMNNLNMARTIAFAINFCRIVEHFHLALEEKAYLK